MNPIRQIIFGSSDKYVEVQSDLFQGSGVNASTSDTKIRRYQKIMEEHEGWGPFPPIHGVILEIDSNDIEDYQEAANGGYEHELDWSRPLKTSDIGIMYVAVEDGHNRAWAAHYSKYPIRVKEWT